MWNECGLKNRRPSKCSGIGVSRAADASAPRISSVFNVGTGPYPHLCRSILSLSWIVGMN